MHNKKIRLLLVEDDKVDQMAFERFVSREDLPYDYTIAGSVAEGKEILKSINFDVIISDYLLGDGTSFELFDQFKDIPVIVTTGSGDEDVAVKAMKLGASDYLIKDPEGRYLKVLPATVDLALKRQQDEKELQNYQQQLESLVVARTAELQAEILEREKMSQTYKELVERTTDLITQVDAKKNLLYVNHMGKTIFGSDPDLLIGQDSMQFIHPEDREKTEAWFKNCVKKQMTQGIYENRQINLATGDSHDLLWTCNFHYNKTGQLISVNGIAHDITERKKAEAAIRKSEERWYRTFNSFTDIVTIQSSDLRIIKANRAAQKIFRNMKNHHHCYELFLDAESPCPNCPVLESKKNFKPYTRAMRHEELDKTFLVSASPIFDEQGELEYIAHVAKDITEIEKLQNQLNQAQKMEAIGLMAGGMAHNFNNNLSIILGNIELSQIKLPPNSEAFPLLDNAKIAVHRARDLIQNILIYSRQGTSERVSIQLPSVIEETFKLLHAIFPTTIKLSQSISPECYAISINADPSQIQEILLNLCNNAMHAMQEDGELKVLLAVVDLAQKDIPAQHKQKPGRYAKLSIQDNGCGMPAEMLEKIFDPFFTTKALNVGTGVGLSTVQGIMERHHGLIKVQSLPGQGSTFDLYFPISHTQSSPSVSIVQEFPQGTENILYIDDDEILAELGKGMLTEMGYQVSVMTDSVEALKLFKANADYFDLVITDQTMPKLTGKELLKELLSIRPTLPTILCTGYSSQINESEAKKMGISAFLMKPVDFPGMLQIIRGLLDDDQT